MRAIRLATSGASSTKIILDSFKTVREYKKVYIIMNGPGKLKTAGKEIIKV